MLAKNLARNHPFRRALIYEKSRHTRRKHNAQFSQGKQHHTKKSHFKKTIL